LKDSGEGSIQSACLKWKSDDDATPAVYWIAILVHTAYAWFKC